MKAIFRTETDFGDGAPTGVLLQVEIGTEGCMTLTKGAATTKMHSGKVVIAAVGMICRASKELDVAGAIEITEAELAAVIADPESMAILQTLGVVVWEGRYGFIQRASQKVDAPTGPLH